MLRKIALATLLSIVLAGCNDGDLVSPAEPTPEPTEPPPPNEAPIADIDASPLYSTNETAHFDGYWSYDPDGYIVSYDWSIVSAPAGSSSVLVASGTDGSAVNWFVDFAGDYTLQLLVTDDDGLTDTETFSFSATPSALHVQVAWPTQYGQADMDLHLVAVSAETPAPGIWSSAWDCHYTNCKTALGDDLEWGVAGLADNPRLDVDNITIDVPENTVIQTPSDGTYRVLVHYYYPHAGGGDIPIDLQVNVWIGTSGTPAFSGTKTLTVTDQVWEVADIVWLGGGGTVNVIDSITTTTKPGFFTGVAKAEH